MSKQFWGVIIAVFVIFGGISLLTNKSDSTSSNSKTNAVSNHIVGSGSEKVTLLEYGDFQCPYCAQYFPVIEQVKEKYKDDIIFQFRHYPLVNIHQNAFAASRAAEAASKQNKFWEMHDIIYQNQEAWSSASDPMKFFKQFAQSIGINETQFAKDYASSVVNDTINADIAAGSKLKVTGTPAFFVDGKKTEIGQSLASFEKVLDDAIAKKAKTAKPKAEVQTPATDTPATTETPAATEESAAQTSAGN